MTVTILLDGTQRKKFKNHEKLCLRSIKEKYNCNDTLALTILKREVARLLHKEVDFVLDATNFTNRQMMGVVQVVKRVDPEQPICFVK